LVESIQFDVGSAFSGTVRMVLLLASHAARHRAR